MTLATYPERAPHMYTVWRAPALYPATWICRGSILYWSMAQATAWSAKGTSVEYQ